MYQIGYIVCQQKFSDTFFPNIPKTRNLRAIPFLPIFEYGQSNAILDVNENVAHSHLES